jgi:hypothetical protein
MVAGILKQISAAWKSKLAIAKKAKRDFTEQAREGMLFYGEGTYDFLYDVRSKYSGITTSMAGDFPMPAFQITHNRVAELVQLFLPQLMHKNPVRLVQPRRFPDLDINLAVQATMQQMGMQPASQPSSMNAMAADPMAMQQDPAAMQAMMMQQMIATQLATSAGTAAAQDEARAKIMGSILNYTPVELDLKGESRLALTEALIKGCGVLKTELYVSPTTGQRIPGSFYESVDRVLVDPDGEDPHWRDCLWVACEVIHPVWQVEQEYGYEPNTLKGNLESAHHQGASVIDPGEKSKRQQGRTNDLLRYWKIYSKMGLGSRLAGEMGSAAREISETIEGFGPYCYLVIAEHVDHPLNLQPKLVETWGDEEIKQAVQWPTPFWYMPNGWPVRPIIFHEKPGCVWPQSHIAPALGELRFLNWAYSFVATKIKTTCRDMIAVMKSAGEDIEKQLRHGADWSMIQIESSMGVQSIGQMVQFLSHPPFNSSIWDVVEAVTRSFEKRTGLMDLLYGQQDTQDRSATGTSAKLGNLSLRPSDMRECFEQQQSDLSRMEALCARWHLQPQDVAPIVGPVGALLWQQLIMASDIQATVTQLEYRIEAGSTARPNKEWRQESMSTALQTMLPILNGVAQQTGNVGPINALLKDWAEAMDIPNVERYFIPPPPPPPPMPMPPAEGGVAAEGQQAA